MKITYIFLLDVLQTIALIYTLKIFSFFFRFFVFLLIVLKFCVNEMDAIKKSSDCKACSRKQSRKPKAQLNEPDNPVPISRYPSKKTSCKRSTDVFFHVSVSILIWAIIIMGILYYKKTSPKDIHTEGFLAKMKESKFKIFSFILLFAKS
uniref:Uncharacterized protein n=1 Tax=Glossina pallidipes TaxID=7398 RepID=A0A1B0A0V6_GLOPL